MIDIMENQQREICKKYGVPFLHLPDSSRIGIALNVRDGIFPVHGLRHPQEEGTSGWYIWVGEFSDAPDFFKPLHSVHLKNWRPEVEKYLGLPPGWRFLIAKDHEDVWCDEALLTYHE